MKALANDYLFEMLDQKMINSIIYYVCTFNEKFQFKSFKKSALEIMKEYEYLLGNIKGISNVKEWVRIDTDYSKIIHEYKIDDEQVDAKELFHSFIKSKDNFINIHKDFPVKIAVFHITKNCVWNVVFCLHHAVSDHAGWMELIKHISARYCEHVSGDSRETHSQLFRFNKGKKVYLKPQYMTQFTKNKDIYRLYQEQKKQMKPIVEKQHLESHRNSNIVVSLYATSLEEIKKCFSEYEYTINDILVYFALKVNSILDDEKNDVSYTSYRMDLRPYLQDASEGLMGNYSFEIPITVQKRDIYQKKSIKTEIDKSKQTLAGYGELEMYRMFDSMLTGIASRIIRFGSIAKCQDKCKGMGVTNMGRLDGAFSDFGNCLQDVYSFSGGFYYGAPLLHVSSYKGKIHFNLVGYRDKERTFQRFDEQLRKLIHKITNEVNSRGYPFL